MKWISLLFLTVVFTQVHAADYAVRIDECQTYRQTVSAETDDEAAAKVADNPGKPVADTSTIYIELLENPTPEAEQ